METTQPAKKLTKTKARLSLGLSRTSPSTVIEPPADVNGEKETEQEEPVSENNKELAEEDDTKKEEAAKPKAVTQGKKRKLDETKDTEPQSEDSNNEFHGFGEDSDIIADKGNILHAFILTVMFGNI